jgi:hypothetical protein
MIIKLQAKKRAKVPQPYHFHNLRYEIVRQAAARPEGDQKDVFKI